MSELLVIAYSDFHRAAVEDAGFYLVDPRHAFNGHEVSGRKGPWTNGVTSHGGHLRLKRVHWK